jgi:signal transduction histidine kinase/HAMP domain-containing protein
MYVLVFFGTALAAAFIVLTRRWILQPIRRLIRSAQEIRGGNLDLVVPGNKRDEIGQLSEAFNDMTASLREFRRTDHAKLLRIQHATQRAFDSLPDAVAVIDPQGNVEVATEPARKIFGLKPGATVIGLEPAWLVELYAEAMRTGRHAALPDHRLIQEFLEGEERYFRPEAIPILDSQRLTAGVVIVLQDVTQLRQQDDLKRGVIRTVSHQLRTPLTSIRMAIHLLLEEKVGPLTEKQAELLVTAREDSDRLNDILSNLLDISRIESGKARLEFRALPPRMILVEARESVWRTAQDQGVDLLLDVEDDLPDVWVDTTRIGYVFTNLLTNALKYTPAGGTITLSARGDEPHVRFAVSDTGPGIPAQYIDRVFEPFFRVPGAEKPQGAGLGLAIVKEIVEAHGGTVVAESREGKGASFSFTLRRADRPLEEGRKE